MKKSLLFIALAAFTFAASAQDTPTDGTPGSNSQITSKNGRKVLPESGQWGLVIEADPFLRYFGDLLNGTDGNNTPSFEFPNSYFAITGKCVKDAGTMHRLGLRLGLRNDKQNYPVVLDSTDGSSFTTTQYGNDEQKISSMNVILSAGIEKHRGVSRINGYYGAEAWIGIGSGKTTNTFANQMTADPDSLTGGGNGNYTPTTAIPGEGLTSIYRTEIKNGSTFMFGVRGFIGADYYVAPQIAIGGEFGWGIGISSTGAGETTQQYFDAPTSNTIKTETLEGPGKSNTFGFDTDNGMWLNQFAGSLHLAVYF